MTGKSEMIVKSVGKIILVKMTMSVVVVLTRTRHLAEYILIGEDKLKTN